MIFVYFLVCKKLSNDDIWVARGIILQEIRPVLSFETGDFAKEKLGELPTVH